MIDARAVMFRMPNQYVSLTEPTHFKTKSLDDCKHHPQTNFVFHRITQAKGKGSICSCAYISWLWMEMVGHWNSSHIYNADT